MAMGRLKNALLHAMALGCFFEPSFTAAAHARPSTSQQPRSVKGRTLPSFPPQSTVQVAVLETIKQHAKQASDGATPALVALLTSEGFRSSASAYPGCSPALGDASPQDILEWFGEELAVAEQVHNFAVDPMSSMMPDVTVEQAMEAHYPDFYNQWTLERLYPTPTPPSANCSLLRGQRQCDGTGMCRWTAATSTCTDLAVANVVDTAEVGIFGYPAFTGPQGTPRTMDETADRPIYVAFNLRKVDAGNPLFGAVSAVYSDSLRSRSFFAPLDTGYWEFSGCNTSLQSTGNPSNCSRVGPTMSSCNAVWDCDWRDGACINVIAVKANCTYKTNQDCEAGGHRALCTWMHGHCELAPPAARYPASSCAGWPENVARPSTLGLLDPPAWHHILLASVQTWIDHAAGAAGQLASLICRMKRPELPLTSLDVFKYWEANVDGAIALPKDIKFLVASFAALFGTAEGEQVQQWCSKSGFLLVWSLGTGHVMTSMSFTPGGPSFGYNHRAVDPIVATRLNATNNVTVSASTKAQFQEVWNYAATHRGNVTAAHPIRTRRELWSSLSVGFAQGPPTPSPSNLNFTALWAELPGELAVAPLGARHCADPARCIGTFVSTRDCLCYHDGFER
eukprot:m.455117 g.455117  ORF g.455117 m.455117 type:complete len:623 (+) comp20808_c0_seq1:85-1953(+)